MSWPHGLNRSIIEIPLWPTSISLVCDDHRVWFECFPYTQKFASRRYDKDQDEFAAGMSAQVQAHPLCTAYPLAGNSISTTSFSSRGHSRAASSAQHNSHVTNGFLPTFRTLSTQKKVGTPCIFPKGVYYYWLQDQSVQSLVPPRVRLYFVMSFSKIMNDLSSRSSLSKDLLRTS